MRKTLAALLLRHGTFQAWQVGFKMRCWGDPQNALILILFYLGKTNRLRGVHFGESQFKIYGFSSITLAFLPPFWGFSEYGTVTSKAIPEILTSKSSNPLHVPGDFRKFNMFATCSPKTNRKQFYLSGFGSAFPDEGRGRGFWFLQKWDAIDNLRTSSLNWWFDASWFFTIWSGKKITSKNFQYIRKAFHTRCDQKLKAPNILQNTLLQVAPCCISSKWRPT